MKFLLTNDDGIDAPGLGALERAAALRGTVRTVAPRDAHSGCSHVVTVHRPLSVCPLDNDRLHVDGTPGDCSRLGLLHLFPDTDWVLSGVNAGGNLGADIYLSGTVAAAREAALFGKPAVALSHFKRRDLEFDWERIVPWITRVLEVITNRSHVPGTFWNVNLPHLPPGQADPKIIECSVDRNPLGVRYTVDGTSYRYAGDYHGRPRVPGSDVDVCFSGSIAITELRLS
ncbi:MAG: 5'/3'-nucleotidase SurE [Gemmataceae bacterium]|nr:5'/3'-nucleotidase SurE [Gemmataceae bacterium]